MTKKELYRFAYQFLLEKDGVTENIIQKHFQPEYNKPKCINDIFIRLCETAQNKQVSTKLIEGSIDGIDKLQGLLFDFNPKKVSKTYGKNDSEELLNEIISKIKPKGQIRRTSRSLWSLYCQSIIDSAHFLSEFKDVESFYNWAGFFTKNQNQHFQC